MKYVNWRCNSLIFVCNWFNGAVHIALWSAHFQIFRVNCHTEFISKKYFFFLHRSSIHFRLYINHSSRLLCIIPLSLSPFEFRLLFIAQKHWLWAGSAPDGIKNRWLRFHFILFDVELSKIVLRHGITRCGSCFVCNLMPLFFSSSLRGDDLYENHVKANTHNHYGFRLCVFFSFLIQAQQQSSSCNAQHCIAVNFCIHSEFEHVFVSASIVQPKWTQRIWHILLIARN